MPVNRLVEHDAPLRADFAPSIANTGGENVARTWRLRNLSLLGIMPIGAELLRTSLGEERWHTCRFPYWGLSR